MSAPARSTNLAIAPGTMLLLDVCDERLQTAFTSHRRDDAPAYEGTEDDPFMARNWTPDDRTSQENQIRARDQYQSEYNKTP